MNPEIIYYFKSNEKKTITNINNKANEDSNFSIEEVKKIVDAGGAYIILESNDNLSPADIKK